MILVDNSCQLTEEREFRELVVGIGLAIIVKRVRTLANHVDATLDLLVILVAELTVSLHCVRDKTQSLDSTGVL